jgi:F0F1-type ATP synthase assembly protein I
VNTEQIEQNKNEYEAEAKKILKKIYKIKDSNIIRETEELSEINEKVQKSIRHIILGGIALFGFSVGVVIGIITDGWEEQEPAFRGYVTFVIVSIVFFMFFHTGQVVERISVKKLLTKNLNLRLDYKVKEIREEEKGNGKIKK